MAELSLSQAQGIYTEALASVFKDKPVVYNFLRSFFPDKIFQTLLVNVLAQRSTEFIAMDVYRGESGNRNTWSRSTQKILETFYFREKFDATRLQLYEKMYSGIGINADIFAAWINDIVEHQVELRETIERTIELMCSMVLENGEIIAPGTGIVIDYKRKAESMVDLGAGNYWDDAGVDPYLSLEASGVFMRTKGKVQGSSFNLILGSECMPALKSNAKFLSQQNLFNMKLDDFVGPQRNSKGANLHGFLTTDNYKFYVWTYPEYYQDPNTNVMTPYINPKKAIVLPEGFTGFTAFGAVPQVVTSMGGLGKMIVPKSGNFVMSDNVDEEARTHYYNVESAPLPVLDAVDKVYTIQPVA
jgi:hypothetical protein